MGNSFIQELTKRAVLMLLPFEVGFDTVVAGVLLPEELVDMIVFPRPRKRASQRMVRCWARVVRKERRR
jgi:hypothetical protein